MPSYHSRITTDEMPATIEVELTKDHAVHEVTSGCMTDRFPIAQSKEVSLSTKCIID